MATSSIFRNVVINSKEAAEKFIDALEQAEKWSTEHTMKGDNQVRGTGIIRRIDDLGRVVMPKEIRRTLRLHEGDPMELYVQDGGVLLKKYSPMSEMSEESKKYIKSLHRVINKLMIITDRDGVIATAGKDLYKLANREISHELDEAIGKGVFIVEKIVNILDADDTYKSHSIFPIIFDGEPIGSITILEDGLNEDDVKIIKVAVDYLGNFNAEY